MTNYVDSVHDFHMRYNHYISERAEIPADKTVNLRYRLIEEEMLETLGALRDIMNFADDNNEKLLTLLADGIADSIVVLIGTALSFGIPIDEVFAEVHRSNMTKSTEKDIHGKTIKGYDYESPRIGEIIRKAMR